MRKRPLSLIFLLACVWAGLAAAPVQYDEPAFKKDDYVFNVFKRHTGNWDTALAWELKHVPKMPEEAVIENSSVKISSKSPEILALLIGGRQPTSLTVSEGAQLDVASHVRVGRSVEKTNAILSIEGGHLRVGTSGEGKGLRIGDSGTHSSTGRMYVRTGTFEGGLFLGSALVNTGVGTLSVVGSTGSLGGRLDHENFWVQSFGVIEFMLDAQGVSTINYKNATVGLSKGARILVAGDRYTGGSQTIILIAAKRLRNDGAQVECTGFSQNYAVKTEVNRRGLVLVIRKK